MQGTQRVRVTHGAWSAAALTIGVAILAAGCTLFGMQGQGPVTTETRQVGAYTRVEVSGGITVDTTIGATPSVQVTAQQNILPIIVTEVQGDTLKIHSTQGYSTSQGVTVTIVNPTLEGFTASGDRRGRSAHWPATAWTWHSAAVRG